MNHLLTAVELSLPARVSFIRITLPSGNAALAS